MYSTSAFDYMQPQSGRVSRIVLIFSVLGPIVCFWKINVSVLRFIVLFFSYAYTFTFIIYVIEDVLLSIIDCLIFADIKLFQALCPFIFYLDTFCLVIFVLHFIDNHLLSLMWCQTCSFLQRKEFSIFITCCNLCLVLVHLLKIETWNTTHDFFKGTDSFYALS